MGNEEKHIGVYYPFAGTAHTHTKRRIRHLVANLWHGFEIIQFLRERGQRMEKRAGLFRYIFLVPIKRTWFITSYMRPVRRAREGQEGRCSSISNSSIARRWVSYMEEVEWFAWPPFWHFHIFAFCFVFRASELIRVLRSNASSNFLPVNCPYLFFSWRFSLRPCHHYIIECSSLFRFSPNSAPFSPVPTE